MNRNRRHAFGLLALLLGGAAQAQTVYKCRDAQGHIAYQDRACAIGTAQASVELAPAPPPAPSPEYSSGAAARTAPRRASARAARGRSAQPMSYECRAGNGEVFYRHGGCPKSISVEGAPRSHGARRGAAAASVTVSARPLERSEACRRLAGSVGRAGRDRDETVSTYERNAGRDPCR